MSNCKEKVPFLSHGLLKKMFKSLQSKMKILLKSFMHGCGFNGLLGRGKPVAELRVYSGENVQDLGSKSSVICVFLLEISSRRITDLDTGVWTV